MDRRDFIKLIPATAISLQLAQALKAMGIKPQPDYSMFNYNNPPLILTDDSITDALGTTTLDNLPNRKPAKKIKLKKATPIIEKLWDVALSDVESNIVQYNGAKYFGAGRQFGPIVYTRDISISGVLGLNKLYPDIMRSSLEHSRNVRWELGFKTAKDHKIEQINVDWELEGKNTIEFLKNHQTNSYTRRTDDIVWLWCAGDLVEDSKKQEDWLWLYQWGKKFFERFYDPFYDPMDGLYRAQAIFMDIHYGVRNSSAYPQDWSISDCALAKATSTNCAYVRALEVMAQAAKKIGNTKESKHWSERAEKLKQAIRSQLRHPDGTFAYYKDRWGKLTSRREALGTSLAVILGIVKNDEAKKAMAGYPLNDIGVPLFDPFFDDTNIIYHNNTSWPFVNAFFMRALEKANNKSTVAESFALMGRVCKKSSGFLELINYKDKIPTGSASQLWSAAGFVDVCFRAGLL